MFQLSVYKRNEECLALERALKFFPIVHMTGIEGVGKTTLVRDFLESTKVPNHWFTLSSHLTLQDIAGNRELDFDQAILSLIRQIQNLSNKIVVWDNLHFLSQANQKKLIYELMHACPTQKIIFLSDEDMIPIRNEPVIRLGPLDVTQAKKFFDFFESGYSEIQVNKIFKRTGGIIAQLKLCLLDPDSGLDPRYYLNSLTNSAREGILILAFSPVPLFESEIQSEDLLELERKYLIEIGKDKAIVCREFIRERLKEVIEQNEVGAWRMRAAQKILQRKNLDVATSILCALETSDIPLALNESRSLSLEKIEEFNQSQISQLAHSLLSAREKLFDSKAWRLIRILIHCLILQNKRADAIDFSFLFLKSVEWNDFQEEQFLAGYDALYWVNRSARFLEVETLRARMTNLAKRPIQFLFLIEQSFVAAQAQKKPQQTITNLQRILTDVESSIQQFTAKENSVLLLARGNVAFQLGIQYMEILNYPNAAHFFEIARDTFQSIKRKYLELFCEFNICLIFSFESKTERLNEKLQRLRTAAQIYGFPYLQAGVCLLLAEQHIEKMEFQKALTFIDEAQGKLDSGMPQNSQIAILASRIRILGHLRLGEALKESISDFMNRFGKNQKNLVELLSTETQYAYRNVEEIIEWMESEELKEEDTSHIELYLLQRGVLPPGKDLNSYFDDRLRSQTAALEYEIIQNVEAKDLESLKTRASELNRILGTSSEKSISQLAASILVLSLDDIKSNRTILDLMNDIQLGPWTNSEKAFFQSWLIALRDGIEFDRVQQLKVCTEREIERWGRWVVKKSTNEQVLVTPKGRVVVESTDIQPNTKGLFLIERQNEVFFDGLKIESFAKKPILIQILSAVLSAYPNHLTKSALSSLLWNESYDPSVHDARVYTSIQRIRQLIGESAIENWKTGYRWSQKVDFAILKENKSTGLRQNRLQNFFIELLRKRNLDSDPKHRWVSKKELVDQIETSDATAKRTLAILLKDGQIERTGTGSQIKYKIKGK